MRIIVATIGSRGDVQPYINLCQGLRDAGHDVRLTSNPTVRPLAESHGVPFIPVGRPVDMGAEGARLLAQSFGNMWIGLIRVMQLAARLVEEAYPEVLEICREADLVVTSDTGSGVAEAGKLGKPWISVTLQPARLPVLRDRPPGLVGRIFGSTMGRLFTGPTNRFRKRVGAPPVEDITSMLSKRMILLPVSPAVAPANPGWAAQIRQTGYWFARPLEGWRPPQDLLEFLKQGEKPIAVSLGVMSTSGKNAWQSARIVLDAVRQSGVRAVLQGWDVEILKALDAPLTIHPAGSLPHDWLFGQASAIVHHGGFGTTAAGLRSGVPGIVIPHILDQYYWAQRVYELGVGPKFIPRTKLTADRLAQAVQDSLTDPSLRARASELGRIICHEPEGVLQAVRLIEKSI